MYNVASPSVAVFEDCLLKRFLQYIYIYIYIYIYFGCSMWLVGLVP